MALVVENSLLLSNIEELYALLPNKNVELDIKIPDFFTNVSFGSRAALCQFLMTWVRKTASSSSILANLQDNEDSLTNFVDDFGLYICLMTAKEGRRIFDYAKQIDFTEKILEKSLVKLNDFMPRINSKTNEKTFIGSPGPIKILCFDHSVNKRIKFNEWFYQDGKLLDEPVIEKFYNAAIKHMLKEHGKKVVNEILNANVSELITGIIKELFENTEVHAKTGYGLKANVPLSPNMRGVFLDLHRGNWDQFNKKLELDSPLYKYFNNLFSAANYTRTFLEISILDSGPGFAQKKSKISLDKLSIYGERDIVLQCLSLYDRTPGMRGLKRMAFYLGNNNGLFKLRTGRLCVYRDFLIYGYEKNDYGSLGSEMSAAKRKYLDWQKDDRGLSILSSAAGSLITIFFPLT